MQSCSRKQETKFKPPPAAAPFIAAMQIVGDSLIFTRSGCSNPVRYLIKSTDVSLLIDSANACMSAPAEKNFPSPVITIALISLSSIQFLIAFAMTGIDLRENDALAESPLSFTRLTPSAILLTSTVI